jgi:hypothetical protein
MSSMGIWRSGQGGRARGSRMGARRFWIRVGLWIFWRNWARGGRRGGECIDLLSCTFLIPGSVRRVRTFSNHAIFERSGGTQNYKYRQGKNIIATKAKSSLSKNHYFFLPFCIASICTRRILPCGNTVRIAAPTRTQMVRYAQDVQKVQLKADCFLHRIAREDTLFCQPRVLEDLLRAEIVL